MQGKPLAFVAREKISSNGWSLDILGDFARQLEKADGREEDRLTWLLRHGPDLISLIEVIDGWVDVATAGNDIVEVKAISSAIATAIASRAPGNMIPITFWTVAPDKYPQPFMRKLEVPAWQELEGNYNRDVTGGMKDLFALKSCPKERLILWHGQPGTGKTHALRALIHEWRDWCDVAFITDPELFVGGSPQGTRKASHVASTLREAGSPDIGNAVTCGGHLIPPSIYFFPGVSAAAASVVSSRNVKVSYR